MQMHIHVNRQKIAQNRKKKKSQPVLTAKTYKSNKYSRQVEIVDDNGKVIAKLVQACPETGYKQLSCGSIAYIIADSKNIKVK